MSNLLELSNFEHNKQLVLPNKSYTGVIAVLSECAASPTKTATAIREGEDKTRMPAVSASIERLAEERNL